MKSFLLRWLVTTVGVAVAVQLTGMHSEGWGPLACMALMLGIVNAFVRPALLLLSIPFILLTLGIFIPILNALLFWFASKLVPGFQVETFWQAFFGSIIVSLVNWSASSLFGNEGSAHFRVQTRRTELSSEGEKVVHGRVVGE